MLYKMIVLDNIEYYKEDYILAGDFFIINIRNIVTIKPFYNYNDDRNTIIGININGVEYPLTKTIKDYLKLSEFKEKLEIKISYVQDIFNEIVDRMKKMED